MLDCFLNSFASDSFINHGNFCLAEGECGKRNYYQLFEYLVLENSGGLDLLMKVSRLCLKFWNFNLQVFNCT